MWPEKLWEYKLQKEEETRVRERLTLFGREFFLYFKSKFEIRVCVYIDRVLYINFSHVYKIILAIFFVLFSRSGGRGVVNHTGFTYK